MNDRLDRLNKVLTEINVNNKPILTEQHLNQVVDAIAEAAFDCKPKDVPWNELTDAHLQYELCVLFGWESLQDYYQNLHAEQWDKLKNNH